jgi:hypothetical protein
MLVLALEFSRIIAARLERAGLKLLPVRDAHRESGGPRRVTSPGNGVAAPSKRKSEARWSHP